MVALAFVMNYIFSLNNRRWIWLILSALFTFFSFFTKQDGGGMAFLLCSALLLYHSIKEREWISLPVYIVSFILIAFAGIYPFTHYNIGYWFNHGQPPHTSRVDPFEILDEFFYSSQWIKFYLFIILLLTIAKFRSWSQLFTDKRSFLFLLLTLGILAEASILQVTSYTPPDNNIFFHSFAFAYILSLLTYFIRLDLRQVKYVLICGAGLLLWWSGTYWKYFQRLVQRGASVSVKQVSSENIVNRKTYKINTYDATDIPMSQWVYSDLKTFDRVYMPRPTVEGIHRLLNMPLVKEHKDLKVLNMSELTPLAVEMPYKTETGPDQPLWYHLGVSMFNREATMYEQRIAQKKYDLVLFEYIPTLNNFYPFRVRDSLQLHYQKIDSFAAPRRGDTQGVIEVYVK
jgi:hypothetical protein